MAETTVTLESTLSALIEGKKYAALRDILVTMNPADVAAVRAMGADGVLIGEALMRAKDKSAMLNQFRRSV